MDQELAFKYFGRDPVSGNHRLSRKAIFTAAASVKRSLYVKKTDSTKEEEKKASCT